MDYELAELFTALVLGELTTQEYVEAVQLLPTEADNGL